MKGHNRLTGTRRARNPRRAAVIPFDQLPLGRMEKDAPFLPGIFESPRQLFNVLHNPETTLGIRMIERICPKRHRLRDLRLHAGSKVQQCLGGFTGEMIGQLQDGVLIGFTHLFQPLGRHSEAQQVTLRKVGKQERLRRDLLYPCNVIGNSDFLDDLPDLNELRGSGLRVGFEFTPLGPVIGLIVVIDVAE